MYSLSLTPKLAITYNFLQLIKLAKLSYTYTSWENIFQKDKYSFRVKHFNDRALTIYTEEKVQTQKIV